MATTDQIAALYRKYLGRDPYANEGNFIKYWSGMSLDAAEQGIANSDEAKARAGSSAPSTQPQSSGDTLDGYIARATARMGTAYEDAASSVISAGEGLKQAYEERATQTEARVSSVQQTYANLSKELAASQLRESRVAERVGEQNIGSARASVAAAGMGEGQGSFRAVITAAQNDLIANIGSIADKYNLKQESLASEMNSTIQEIFDKAADYRLQGQKAMSDALLKVAELKIDKQKEILSYAQQLYSNDMELQKFQAQLAENERQYQLEVKKYQASLASSAASSSRGKKVVNESGGLTFYDSKGNPITVSEYASANGISIAQALQGSKDPGDAQFIKEYNDALTAIGQGNITESAAVARLTSKYGHMGKITL